ncbi:hypothetical protein NDU88_003625 [Pleurodeles waltl]|uniref:Uncharacterized protein n=1 Tax=Pleurodeles waltl TaxID=8319 RepID=A0AAV7T734_PLEWA|nr:hypothetical protein NDU88_003625 [Pleurodeles waltl]
MPYSRARCTFYGLLTANLKAHKPPAVSGEIETYPIFLQRLQSSMTQETCAQAHISIAIDQAGKGKQKSHKDKNMEDSHNAGPKEYKADTDQVLSNDKDHETGKENSIPTGEQAASLISETESTMGLEQSVMVE